MKNTVAAAALDIARVLNDNGLTAVSLNIENPTSRQIGVGENLRALLSWARHFDLEKVTVDRRNDDCVLTLEAQTEGGVKWTVKGSYKKIEGVRSRFPGITVDWQRRAIGGSRSARGTITPAQLEVLIGRLGV